MCGGGWGGEEFCTSLDPAWKTLVLADDFSLLGRVIALVWIGTGTPLLAPRQALEPL